MKIEDARKSGDLKGSENVNIDVDESIQLLASKSYFCAVTFTI